LAVLFGLFVIWYVFVGRGVPPRISVETTWITEPRTADGKWIDYCKAYEQLYYPPEMQTDDNGYRIIARHLGLPDYELTYFDPKTKEHKKYDLDKEALRRQGYEKLGLPGDSVPDMKLINTYELFRDQAQAEEIHPDSARELHEKLYYKLMESPWTLDEYPVMVTWLENNSPVLDMFSEAVAKPAFHLPLIVPDGYESLQQLFVQMHLIQIQEFRNIAREFQIRFQYRLAQGDIDGAIEDKIAVQRLGRNIQFEGTLVCFLVGVAIDGIAYSQGIADNLEAQPTAEQIRRLMKLQSELRPGMTVKEARESERLFILDGLQGYACGPPKSPAYNIQPSLVRFWGGGLPMDWNIVFSRANKYIDGRLEVKPAGPSGGNFVRSVFIALFSRNKRSEMFIDTLAALFVPAINAAEEAKRRLDCCTNLQRITLAMLLYHAEHGTLPPAYSVDATGKRLHSWRVLLLPYLGDVELAKLHGQIRLDEPWDSEHNKQFHEQSLAVYRCPSGENQMFPGDTGYCVIVGDETPFDNSGTGKSLIGFGPESGGMVLIAETRVSGNWMNPCYDMTFEQAKTGINGTPGDKCVIGSYHTGGANFGLRIGGVSFFSETIVPEVWQNVLTGKERVR
jgi:hypothetical protein